MTTRLVFWASLCLAGLACRPDPATPDPQLPQETLDSLVTLNVHSNVTSGDTVSPVLTIKLPRFEAVIRQSQTPAGQLDKAVADILNPSSGTQYLYNKQGKPAGYSNFWPDASRHHTTLYYEYKDNSIYRVYTKVYEGEIAKDFIYFMTEYRYTDGHATSMYSYSLDLTKAKAYFNSIVDISYDYEGHVITIRDRKPTQAYDKLIWQGDNIIGRQGYHGDNTSLGFGYIYTHDGKPNPLKAFELPDLPVSGHNELTETTWYSTLNYTYLTSYELVYNPLGYLASSVTVQSGYPPTRRPPVYYVYK